SYRSFPVATGSSTSCGVRPALHGMSPSGLVPCTLGLCPSGRIHFNTNLRQPTKNLPELLPGLPHTGIHCRRRYARVDPLLRCSVDFLDTSLTDFGDERSARRRSGASPCVPSRWVDWCRRNRTVLGAFVSVGAVSQNLLEARNA